MRKAFMALLLSVVGVGTSAACAYRGGKYCETYDCPSESEPEPTCDGVCVPYMDSTWDMALVGTASNSRVPLHCPASAPFAGMSGTEIPPDRGPARDVLACSVNPQPTCSSDTFVCVPFDPVFAPCILQPGPQFCPGTYPLPMTVQSAAGHTITVCCEGPDEDPDGT